MKQDSHTDTLLVMVMVVVVVVVVVVATVLDGHIRTRIVAHPSPRPPAEAICEVPDPPTTNHRPA